MGRPLPDSMTVSRRTLNLSRFGPFLLASLAVGFLALVALAVSSVWWLNRAQSAADATAQAETVKRLANDVLLNLRRAESAQRGYIITGEPSYLAGYQEGVEAVPGQIRALQRALPDDADQRVRVERLERLATDKLAELSRTVDLARSGDLEAAADLVRSNEGLELMTAVRVQIEAIQRAEEQRKVLREGETAWANRWLLVVNLSMIGLIAVVALAALATVTRTIDDLRGVGAALEASNAELETRVAQRTAEIARVNDEIQRFAYIVSHDLRAPLVNIMGFTSELQRSEAVLSNQIRTLKEKHREALEPDAVLVVEEDIPEAISYIRASTAKMDRLINAILKLSRDGRRELAVEVVDMTALARGLADTLAQQTGAVGATITVEDLPPIATDRVGMELIIGNIVENAVKYLDPHRPGDIRITGRRLGNRNAYVIADNGRGIDPKDHERVFELFRRAGPQDKPGEGLGLSFVRSAVYRLGGQLEMESAPGVGTTFTLIFPTVPPDPVEPEPYSTGARAA